MYLLPRILVSVLLSGISACTFLPGIDEEQPYTNENCELVTQSLDLKAYMGFDEFTEFESSSKNTPETESEEAPEKKKKPLSAHSSSPNAIIIAALVAWGASTLIISGSIVVSGNILHWSEYQGRCDESALRQFVYPL